jgi:hypothetical protein
MLSNLVQPLLRRLHFSMDSSIRPIELPLLLLPHQLLLFLLRQRMFPVVGWQHTVRAMAPQHVIHATRNKFRHGSHHRGSASAFSEVACMIVVR